MIQIILTTDQRDNNISKYNLYTEQTQKQLLDYLKGANENENAGQRTAVNIAYRLERLIRQEDEARKERQLMREEKETDNE